MRPAKRLIPSLAFIFWLSARQATPVQQRSTGANLTKIFHICSRLAFEGNKGRSLDTIPAPLTRHDTRRYFIKSFHRENLPREIRPSQKCTISTEPLFVYHSLSNPISHCQPQSFRVQMLQISMSHSTPN